MTKNKFSNIVKLARIAEQFPSLENSVTNAIKEELTIGESDDVDFAIQYIVEYSGKLDAVRFLKNLRSMSLLESKKYVEALIEKRNIVIKAAY